MSASAISYIWLAVRVVLTLLKVWLVTAQTLSPVSPMPADDDLFLSQAESILRGEWLGKASDLVTVKGPIYPLWLCLNHISGIPLLLAQSILYVLSCWLFVRALRPVISSNWGRSTLYLAILFNPGSWANEPTTRILREGIYPALTLLLLACIMGTALRIQNGAKSAAPWAVALGLSGALFAMTREEGIWLLPSLAFIMLGGFVHVRGVRLRAWIVPAAYAAAAYGLLIFAVATANERHYGVFTTCETTTEYFKSAYGALTRVKTGNWNPFVPVSREARKMIYSVSPAFREVEPYLEGKADFWTEPGCNALGVCDDIGGGWFMWAFRDAVNAAGKYRQGMSGARDWYRQVDKELDEACRSGRLDCLSRRSSLVSPWHKQYLPSLYHSFLRAGKFLTTLTNVSPQPIPPLANEPEIRRFEEMTREQIPRYRVQMTGLLASRIGHVDARVTVLGRAVDGSVRLEPINLDAGPEGKGFAFWRCNVDTPSINLGVLEFLGKDRIVLEVPIASFSKVWGTDNLKWKTEHYRLVPNEKSIHKPLADFRIDVLEALTKVYAFLTPLLAVLALILLLMRIGRDLRAWSFRAVPFFAMALLTGVIVRLLLLSMIDVSSFPAITVLYCAPAYPLYIAMVVLVLVYEREYAIRCMTGDVNSDSMNSDK